MMGPCLGEAGFGREGPDALECCAGLVRVPASDANGVGECVEEAGGYLCTHCGDDNCGPGENNCNCPNDCEPVACVAAGESLADPNQRCCAGLFAIDCQVQDDNGICMLCDGGSICTNCGDGVCGEGENTCNCAVDCPL